MPGKVIADFKRSVNTAFCCFPSVLFWNITLSTVSLIYSYVFSFLCFSAVMPLYLSRGWQFFFFPSLKHQRVDALGFVAYLVSVLTPRCWWSVKTTQTIGKWKGTTICHFGQWIILSWRQLTNGRHKKSSLPSLYLLKNRAQISYEKRDLLILEKGRELSWETRQ